MTQERDNRVDGTNTSVTVEAGISTPAPLVSRRALLRGAGAAVPTILTLQSGAALAASSNYLATIQNANQALDPNGYVKCIDTASAVQETSVPTRLDLGPNPDLHMQYITPRQYYLPSTTALGGDEKSPVTMEIVCNSGGQYWFKNQSDEWQMLVSTAPAGQQQVAGGFLVSSTAFASVSAWVSQSTHF